MKHILFFLLAAAIATTTACSSNETYSESDKASAASVEATPTPAKPEVTTEPASQISTETNIEEEPEAETQAPTSEAPAPTASSSDDPTVSYVCTHGDNVRTIRVIYYDEGPKACEVTYEKSTGTQSLWNAISDEAYCEDRAAEFVDKQEGWGWNCSKQ